MEKAQSTWIQILDELSRNYEPELMEELFGNAKIINENNGVITILVDTMYIQSRINNQIMQRINKIAPKYYNGPVRFKVISRDDIQQAEIKQEEQETYNEIIFETNLSDSYTFDSFMVGEANRFAQRQALLTAEQPGSQANPLYIFGGVGIGKTHLMHAIGNYILDKDINSKVLYVKAQDYITEFSKASQSKDLSKFDEKYSNLDVLLVDDIQMLGTAKKTQEKFFELFNKMYDNHKQIVITSDKPADQMPDIMPRLTTRFAWGLQVDINTPDLPLKIKILKRKLYETSSNDINISDEILEFIASLYENIRDLEGCLRRVLAYATMNNSNITMDLVKESLHNILKGRETDINNTKYDNVKSVVCDFYNISVSDLVGNKKQSSFVIPRHITMYILRTKYNLTYKQIAELLCKKDHSTIMSAIAKMEEELKVDKELKTSYETILKKIN